MSLKLLPPGKRKNKTYYIIGRDAKGKRVEVSTRTTVYSVAKHELEKAQRLDRKSKEVSAILSFGQAAQKYMDFKRLSEWDQRNINALIHFLGHYPVTDVTRDHVYSFARAVSGRTSNATINRHIITPASAVLKYAVANKWRNDNPSIPKLEVPEPKTRYVADDVEDRLREAAAGNEDKLLLLLWLFRQGDRIGDVCRIKYEDIDLKAMTVERYISKTNQRVTMDLDEDICEIIQNRGKREGFVFPWRSKDSAGQMLRKLSKKAGVQFTAHQARHTLGKRLNDSGVGLKTIMQVLGHKDAKSSLRYQTTGLEEMRLAKRKAAGKMVGHIDKSLYNKE